VELIFKEGTIPHSLSVYSAPLSLPPSLPSSCIYLHRKRRCGQREREESFPPGHRQPHPCRLGMEGEGRLDGRVGRRAGGRTVGEALRVGEEGRGRQGGER